MNSRIEAKAYGHATLEDAIADACVYARNLDVAAWVYTYRSAGGPVTYSLTKHRPDHPVAVVRPTKDGRGSVHVYCSSRGAKAAAVSEGVSLD